MTTVSTAEDNRKPTKGKRLFIYFVVTFILIITLILYVYGRNSDFVPM